MAYGGINEIFAPAVLYQVGKVIEDEGYEACLQKSVPNLRIKGDKETNPEVADTYELIYAEPVEDGYIVVYQYLYQFGRTADEEHVHSLHELPIYGIKIGNKAHMALVTGMGRLYRRYLQTEFMESHEEIKPGVYETIYSDGSKIIVDYNNETWKLVKA